MTEYEKARLQEALGFFDSDMPLTGEQIIRDLLNPGGTMGTAFTEAAEISQQQAAERRRNGEAPYRKPKPTHAEWAGYLCEDIEGCVSVDELNARMDDDEVDAKVVQFWEERHSLWLKIMEAYEQTKANLEGMGLCESNM